jgi:Gpi18-like mannosyltransferase
VDTKEKTQRIEEAQYNNPLAGYFIFVFALFTIMYLSLYKSGNEKPFARGYKFLIFILGLGFVIRVAIAPFLDGFGSDVNLFKFWGSVMSNSPLDMYNKEVVSFCDYPPVYLYIIGLFTKVAGFLGITSESALFTLIIKLPPIIADIASGILIYKICGNRIKDNWKLLFVAVYVFNPMTLLDSAVWGQVDSIWALTVFLAVYSITNNKYILSAFIFGIAIMIKPQALFTGPVLLFAVMKRRDISKFFLCGLSVAGAMLLSGLPYVLRYGPMWILNLFTETAGGYKYASVNSFNFFTLIGKNWVEDSHKFLSISLFGWGILFLGIFVALAGFIFFKMRNEYKSLPYLTALMLSVWVVTFTVRMHERYMYPAILFSLIVAILDNSRFMFKIFALLSTTSFFNSLIILGRVNSDGDIWHFNGNIYVFVICALNILISVLICIYAFRVLKNKGRSAALYPSYNQTDLNNMDNFHIMKQD